MTPKTTLETALVTRAFALEGAGLVWIVETGKLDVFLAPMESGSPAGALTHVTRVEAGGALFALPLDPVSSLGFLAAPAAETVVQVGSLNDLSIDERNELSVAWIEGIARQLPSVPEGLSLAQFHEWAATEWIERRRQAEREHAERLKKRTTADERVVGAALRRLSGHDGVTGGAVESPLAAVCLAVGEAAGIELKIPPSVMQGKARDPLRAIARFSAVRVRRLVLRGDWWKQDSGPMVAFLAEGNKPVALLPRKGSGYDLFDPADETRVRVHRGIAGKLNGVAFVFYRPFPYRSLSGWQVLRAGLRGCGRDLWGIVIAGFLASLLALVTPFATGIVFDSIIPGSDRGQLLQAIIFIVASAVAMTLISLTRSYALIRVEGKLDFATQAAVWDRLLNLPTSFFRKYSAGDLVNRGMAISQIRSILSESVLTAIIAGLFSVTSIFLLFYYSPALSLVAVALAGAALAVTVVAGFMQLGLLREVADSNGKLSGMVFEFVDGIAKFKVSGTEGRAFARWASAFGAQKGMTASIRRIVNFLAAFKASFPIVALLIIFSR